MPEFNWTQPVGGKALTWRPLTVGDEIDVQMECARPETAPLRPYEVLRRRITSFEGRPVCTLAELKQWDTIDVEAFLEEVERTETMRRAAVLSKAAGDAPGSLVELEASLMEMRSAAAQFSQAADKALAKLKAAGPLAVSK